MNLHLLENPRALQSHIISSLAERCGCESLFADTECEKVQSSSVMLLLGEQAVENGNRPEICVILNKRSQEVRQPGDLCCPGGTVETTVDPYLARLLALPFSPLSRWPAWKILRRYQRREARLLSLLLAAGLRESWEEMRLNPFAARFLGPLPSQCLLLFRRVIHPMVALGGGKDPFHPPSSPAQPLSLCGLPPPCASSPGMEIQWQPARVSLFPLPSRGAHGNAVGSDLQDRDTASRSTFRIHPPRHGPPSADTGSAG